MSNLSPPKIRYLTGSILIQAKHTFLNGDEAKPDKITHPKKMHIKSEWVPYVSSQAILRWMRDAVGDITTLPHAKERIETWDLNTEKKRIRQTSIDVIDPIQYPEDDLFGYMFPAAIEADNNEFFILKRDTTFQISPFVPIKGGYSSSIDAGFVHLNEGTPLPYSIEYYHAFMEAVFAFALHRVGSFRNLNKNIKIELDSPRIEKYTDPKKPSLVLAKDPFDPSIQRWDLMDYTERKRRIEIALNALIGLYGGAKQASAYSPVEPKAILFAANDNGNPFLNGCFTLSPDNNIKTTSGLIKPVEYINSSNIIFDIPRFQNLLQTNKSGFRSRIFIGIRKDFFINEKEIYDLHNQIINNIEITVGSPNTVIQTFLQQYA